VGYTRVEEHARDEAPHLSLRYERRDERAALQDRAWLDNEPYVPRYPVALLAQRRDADIDEDAGRDQAEGDG
jgi:hypothetical protein